MGKVSKKRKRAAEGEKTSQFLPDELVGSILARLPFPYVFQARVLSKSWLGRLSSTLSLENDKWNQLLAVSFQKLLRECSKTWKPLCPVFIHDREGYGYDRASDMWRKMPSLSFLPDKFLKRTNLEMQGPLFYALPIPRIFGPGQLQLYVANIVTQTWKEVPQFPAEGFTPARCQKLVIHQCTGTFKVLRFCLPNGVHIYDSKSGKWSVIEEHILPLHNLGLCKQLDLLHSGKVIAYLDGNVYIMDTLRHLISYNVEKGTSEKFYLRGRCKGFERIQATITSRTEALVICNGNLLMLVNCGGSRPCRIVVKIDLDSKAVSDVAIGPTVNRYWKVFYPACDGECIFFGIDKESKWLTYNMGKNEWSVSSAPTYPTIGGMGRVHITRSRAKVLDLEIPKREKYRWMAVSFQPGLNPFMAV